MKTPSHIQRIKFRKPLPQDNPSFDGLLEMEYMGNSDFEWGTLPKRLKILTTAADTLIVVRVLPPIKRFDGAGMFMICKPEDQEYMAMIPDLASEKTHTVERTDLKMMITGRDILGHKISLEDWGNTDVWWDIFNNVIFCFGKKATERILQAIIQTRDNKKAEGKEGWF